MLNRDTNIAHTRLHIISAALPATSAAVSTEKDAL